MVPPPVPPLFVIAVLGNWREIIIFEFDVSIIDMFLLGSLVNNPDSCTSVIFGTLILNVEFVEIPAARIPPWFTPEILWPTETKVKVWPLSVILLTRL